MLSPNSSIKDCRIEPKSEAHFQTSPSHLSLPRSIRLRTFLITKRLVDILVSLIVLSLTWPIILWIAIYIRKKSQGPAIFRQIRITKNRRNNGNSLNFKYYIDSKSGNMFNDRRKHKDIFRPPSDERRKSNAEKLYYLCPKDGQIRPERRKTNLVGQPFIFYKFRTMYADAKECFPELYVYKYTKEEIKHMKFKIENDPRIPKWAEWLRRSSLDELPNFVNILLGDMSVVGPRPDIPEMMKYYTDKQKMKLEVKPGITGLAQIEGRGHLRFQETLKYDVEYVKKQSLLLDLKIIVKTILKTFTTDGAF